MSRPGIALVTGGGRGIGRAIVETLASQDWSVAFTWHSDRAAAQDVEAALPGRAHAFAFDGRDRARPAALVREIDEELGSIVALVNNAGIQRDGLLAMTRDDDWDEVLDVNLGAVFRLCRAVVPGMISRRSGSIVNVASLSAIHGRPGQTAYAASKAGLLGFTRSLAREVGRKGVRVNAVLPGLVETDHTRSLPSSILEALRSYESLRGGTTPSAVAEAVAFLASDAASAITGQALSVDAGASA